VNPPPVKTLPGGAQRGSNTLLILLCLAQFMVILDVSIVNVALPSIKTGLDFSPTGLQWVVNTYTLTFAGFLLLGGRSADLFGGRRVFLFGVGLFAGASLICAVANSQGLLLGARALQGLGAAVVSPASLAVISRSFSEGHERNRAVGVWGAMAGLGGTSGALLGGLLTQGFGWESIFLVNVPIGIAVVLASRRVVPLDGAVNRERDFDALGAVLITGGLSTLVYGIVRTEALGWGSTGVLAPLAAGVLLIAAFLYVEGRVVSDPLVPLRIFKMPTLRTANIAMLLLSSGMFAMWFFVTLYLQDVLGADALLTGVEFLPVTLTIVLATRVASRAIDRSGPKPILVAGIFLIGIGLALLSGVSSDGTYWADVLPGGVVAAFGLGLSIVGTTVAAIQGVGPGEQGLASGMINTSRMVGGALGLAALSTIAADHTDALASSGSSQAVALSEGYGLAFTVGAIVCLSGAVLVATLLRTARPAAEPVGEAA
jgi:EmrB/QacA subfamily drug resistance transporter